MAAFLRVLRPLAATGRPYTRAFAAVVSEGEARAAVFPLKHQRQAVEDFYRARGKLVEFRLAGGITESWPKLPEVLNLENHDNKQSAAA